MYSTNTQQGGWDGYGPPPDVLNKARSRLRNDTFPVPHDLTATALQNVTDLTDFDWMVAELNGYKIDPDCEISFSPMRMPLKMLRIVFFRALDDYYCFTKDAWQTRYTVLCFSLKAANARAQGEQTYLDAVTEAQMTPQLFNSREQYVAMVNAGLTEHPKWPNSVKKKHDGVVAWAKGAHEQLKQQQTHAAAEKLTAELEAMVESFGGIAEEVKKGYVREESLEEKMALLSLVAESGE